MSHTACKPLKDTVIGFSINTPEDIFALTDAVRRNSFDLLQADHTLSGIDIALWDMLGRKMGLPVWKLLGYEKSYPKTAYASQLFGNTPQETYEKAVQSRNSGYRAAKFGWGPFGHGTVQQDVEHVEAAREGLGKDVALMVDAGTVWVDDVERASAVLPVLEKCNAVWLEEPFTSGALKEYDLLSKRSRVHFLAGGEGAHNPDMAYNLIDFGSVAFIQIDTGRIGGISSAKKVAEYAVRKKIKYVNHTFTTTLALVSSMEPFAGLKDSLWCEFPVESTLLAQKLTTKRVLPDSNGQITLGEEPGLGVEVNPDALKRYGKEVTLTYENNVLWRSK